MGGENVRTVRKCQKWKEQIEQNTILNQGQRGRHLVQIEELALERRNSKMKRKDKTAKKWRQTEGRYKNSCKADTE